MDDETAVFLTIEMLRSSPQYHAAEALRRQTRDGSAAMVTMPEGSPERGAALLLISTWESIALLANGLQRRDRLFSVLPVCHMWRELEGAILSIRRQFASYAENFEALYKANEAWFTQQRKDAQYVTAVCGDMYARFG